MMQARFPALMTAVLALSACASADDTYPSLAIRDGERMTGTIAPEPYVPPPPTPSTIAGLEELAAQARAAHADFMAALPAARSRVNAARGSGVGSEAWAVAQVAVADLESDRSRAMIALADLDRIYVAVSTDGEAIAPVEDVRGPIAALVEQENAAIAELLAALR